MFFQTDSTIFKCLKPCSCIDVLTPLLVFSFKKKNYNFIHLGITIGVNNMMLFLLFIRKIILYLILTIL